MEILAINEEETLRVAMFGDMYHLQQSTSIFYILGIWKDVKAPGEEWMASKWILDYGLKVSTDYPTIAEIRTKQAETG